MEEYTEIGYRHAKSLALYYSSSFGLSSRLFPPSIRRHIYAIYGLVRIADEIVDTYRHADADVILNALEAETYAAIDRQFSTNPIVHAFALTAERYAITQDIINPFFESMRMDLEPKTYDQAAYARYIHGSAEVVGLMCLKVFCDNDKSSYESLKTGAKALGAAYQKVNFLRDIAADHNDLGRWYFPNTSYGGFNETAKRDIVADVAHDFARALPALRQLPTSSRAAVMTSYRYYKELLERLDATPAATIKTKRIRLPTARKLQLFTTAAIRQKAGR